MRTLLTPHTSSPNTYTLSLKPRPARPCPPNGLCDGCVVRPSSRWRQYRLHLRAHPRRLGLFHDVPRQVLGVIVSGGSGQEETEASGKEDE